MSLKIVLKPPFGYEGPPYCAIGNWAKVYHMETGVDISEGVKNIKIDLLQNEWASATIEYDLGEVELEGIDVKEDEELLRLIRKE